MNFKWTDVEQKSSEEINQILASNTLLAYPDFNKQYYIHTNASDFQLGVVIIQEGKLIDFCSIK